MKNQIVLALLALSACRDAQPELPTTEQSAQLNEAEAMLNEMGNEEGPSATAPGPSSNRN